MSKRLDRNAFGSERVAFTIISPCLVVSYSALLPSLAGALLATGLAAIALTAGFLVICLLAKLIGRTTEAPTTATDIEGAFLSTTILAALSFSFAVASAVTLATPVRAKAATTGLRATADFTRSLGIADCILLGNDK